MIRISLLILLFLTGCAPNITDTDFFREHPPQTDSRDASTELGIIKDGHLTIRMIASDSLRMGSNILWADVMMNDSPASDGRFAVLVQWVAGTRTVSSPLGTVKLIRTDTPGNFEGISLFVAPLDEEVHWQLQVFYETDGKSGETILPVDIRPSIWVQYADGYYVSWVQPVRPATGLAVIEFALHRLVGENFVPLENATIELFPWMDMGAGQGHSTPYEAPVHVRHGHYKGLMNFIMSGEWEMAMFIQRQGVVEDTVHFNGFTVH